MKIPPLALLGLVASCATGVLHAQTQLAFDNFEAYAPGNLGSQGGWTSLNLNGTSQIVVTMADANLGAKSVRLYDGDTTNVPRIRKDYGVNTSYGRFDFALKEDAATAGRDAWRVEFLETGSSGVRFALLGSSTSLALVGGSTGSTTLTSIAPTSAGYQATGWNSFSIVFNNITHTAAVYLNGASSPILTQGADTATIWNAGRVQIAAGYGSAVDHGIYLDQGLPDWETGSALYYAPPTLVAPTVYPVPASFFGPTLATDEDAIFNLPTGTMRSSAMNISGGRSIRIIGGDMGKNSLGLYGQTRSAYLEGLKFNMAAGLPQVNGLPVDVPGTNAHDAIGMTGVAPNSTERPDVYVQNCHVAGVFGMNRAVNPGVALTSIVCTSSSNFTITTAATLNLAVDDQVVVGPTTYGGFNDSYKVTSVTSGTVIQARRWATWYPPSAPITVGQSATGGYAWKVLSGTGTHGDGYQVRDLKIQNVVHFYKVTIAGTYQWFIGGRTLADAGARGLEMIRVNFRQANVWPQDYDSRGLYIGDTGSRIAPMPVLLDRVYLTPRPNHSLLSTLSPQPGAQRVIDGVTYHVGAYSNDGGLTATWEPDLGVDGFVNYSANGFSGEPGYTGKDYADLTGPNAPGLHYVSPGYSAEAVQPLVLSSVALSGDTGGGNVNLAASSPTGTQATRLDVHFTGDGHIIDLVLTNNAGGKFSLSGRNLLTADALTAGTNYTVQVSAREQGNIGNSLIKNIMIHAN